MKVAIVLYEGFTALDAVGPYEVLSHLPEVEVSFVANEAGPVTADTGCLTLVAEKSLSEFPHPDMILVPGGLKGTSKAMRDKTLIRWLQNAHPQTRWTTSVCTGALILAAAGLLEGLQATTHWLAADRLTKFGATYQAQRFVRQDKVITAAGVSAGIDMALVLAREIKGDTAAQVVQLLLEYDPQPPFDCGSAAKAPADVLALAQKALEPKMKEA